MILKMILKSFDFQCNFDFQITTSKMISILILNHLYLGDLILILKSSTYDDFAHLCVLRIHDGFSLNGSAIVHKLKLQYNSPLHFISVAISFHITEIATRLQCKGSLASYIMNTGLALNEQYLNTFNTRTKHIN